MLRYDPRMANTGTATHRSGSARARRATYQDVLDAPAHRVAEIVDGTLYTQPRRYRGGQAPIVHLEADLHGAIEWADTGGRPWAFSLSNAGARYTEFRRQIDDLEELDWEAIAAQDFRRQEVKEAKQAEFLIHEAFPFELFDRIGVRSPDVAEHVTSAITDMARRPAVEIRADWYY